MGSIRTASVSAIGQFPAAHTARTTECGNENASGVLASERRYTMRAALDTLLDIAEMARCLKREREVSYAKDFFVILYEQAFDRVDADIGGEAKAVRLLIPDRGELVIALQAHIQSRLVR